MLSLPELDIKYLKTGLDADLRPHKQTTLKCIEGGKNPTPLLVAHTTGCLRSKYILGGSNNLLSKVKNTVL